MSGIKIVLYLHGVNCLNFKKKIRCFLKHSDCKVALPKYNFINFSILYNIVYSQLPIIDVDSILLT